MLDEFPRVFGKAFPDFRVDKEKVIFVTVVPDSHILLDFVHFGGFRDGTAVFLTVNRALLDGRKDFAPAHGGGVGAEGVKGVHVDRRTGDADFQAFEVVRLRDGAFAVGQLPETVVERAK